MPIGGLTTDWSRRTNAATYRPAPRSHDALGHLHLGCEWRKQARASLASGVAWPVQREVEDVMLGSQGAGAAAPGCCRRGRVRGRFGDEPANTSTRLAPVTQAGSPGSSGSGWVRRKTRQTANDELPLAPRSRGGVRPNSVLDSWPVGRESDGFPSCQHRSPRCESGKHGNHVTAFGARVRMAACRGWWARHGGTRNQDAGWPRALPADGANPTAPLAEPFPDASAGTAWTRQKGVRVTLARARAPALARMRTANP